MMKRLMLLGLLLLLPLMVVSAQDDSAPDQSIEAQLNDITAILYSPVDGTPLNACTTVQCQDWIAGFRIMLQGEMPHDEIIAHFVEYYGERVTDPALNDNAPIPVVSADEVNDIASSMYCPVCENIPLDTCGTAACQDWREEVRLMLGVGMSIDEIQDDFIRRFGERVVGTPKDPLLHALSVWTPWILVFLGLFGVGRWLYLRRQNQQEYVLDRVPAQPNAPENDDLYAQLEQDVEGR